FAVPKTVQSSRGMLIVIVGEKPVLSPSCNNRQMPCLSEAKDGSNRFPSEIAHQVLFEEQAAKPRFVPFLLEEAVEKNLVTAFDFKQCNLNLLPGLKRVRQKAEEKVAGSWKGALIADENHI